ncbi:MAG: hypothetical protein FWH51_04040, partial [Dehalococcoidia bacterium]|nr:hypothetical protein [Dehalococcoidia bacterium]
RATEAEDYLTEAYYGGHTVTEDSAQAAGDAAIKTAIAISSGNSYIVQIARTMVKRAVLACQ